jgi:hypothetical protein
MYVQGVSTRKVKAVTEELCGHAFSAAAVSAIVKRLDDGLAQFARRRLAEAFPYLILDARAACPPARAAGPGGTGSRGGGDPQPSAVATADPSAKRRRSLDRRGAVRIAVGIDLDGRRGVLAVELAHRESATSWRDLRLGLRERGPPRRLRRPASGRSAEGRWRRAGRLG